MKKNLFLVFAFTAAFCVLGMLLLLIYVTAKTNL